MIFDQITPINFFVEPHLSVDSPFVLIATVNLTFPLHLQYSFELIFCLNGQIQVQISGQRLMMQPGDIAIIPPGTIHGFESSGPSSAIILIFLPHEFPELQSLFAKHKLHDSVINVPKSGISELADDQELATMSPIMRLRVKGFVNTFFADILRSATLIPTVNDSSETIVVEALAYIGREYDMDVNLEITAKQVGVSPSHLSRSFKRVVGCSFSEYVNRVRVDKSKWLLKDGTLPIYNIASECGFGTLRNFDRSFKKLTNQTPTEYRKDSHIGPSGA